MSTLLDLLKLFVCLVTFYWSISSPPTGPVNRYHFTTSVHTLCHLSPHLTFLSSPFPSATIWCHSLKVQCGDWCEPRVCVKKYRQEVGAGELAWLCLCGKKGWKFEFGLKGVRSHQHVDIILCETPKTTNRETERVTGFVYVVDAVMYAGLVLKALKGTVHISEWSCALLSFSCLKHQQH